MARSRRPSDSSHLVSLPKGSLAWPLSDGSIENNPEVMSSLVHKLGLSSELSWHDVYSLDDPSLLAFVPRPAHALLLVFPVSSAYEKARMEEDSSLPDYTGTGSEEEILWFKQTIGNACGLMGLIHATCNGVTRDLIGMSAIPSQLSLS